MSEDEAADPGQRGRRGGGKDLVKVLEDEALISGIWMNYFSCLATIDNSKHWHNDIQPN